MSSRAPTWLAALSLLLSACPKAVPAAAVASQGQAADPVQQAIGSVLTEATEVRRARDGALWAHWVNGAALDLDAPWKGHEALLTATTFATCEQARSKKLLEPERLDDLEGFLVGEAVARATGPAETQIANLEASLTFTIEGKELPFRELSRLLAQERSPARRQAMWAAALTAAERLDAAIDRRDLALTAALEPFGRTRDTWAAELRGVDLQAAAQWADRFLAATEPRWKERLARFGARELKGAPVTRADLVLMERTATGLDAAFPRAKLSERATAVLGSLGLYGVQGLTLELSEAPRKLPLPLTVALAADDVRLCFRPRGGLADQQALLGELGRALALRFSPLPRRLPVEVTATLFGGLTSDPLWLQEQGLSSGLVAAQTEAALDDRLLTLRRACGALLAELGSEEADDPEARAGFVLHSTRALGVALTQADGVRRRIDSDGLYGAVDVLRAQAQAEALKRALVVEVGERWWASPVAGARLKAYWASGSLPESVRERGANGESLLSALGAPTPGGVARASKSAPPAGALANGGRPDAGQ